MGLRSNKMIFKVFSLFMLCLNGVFCQTEESDWWTNMQLYQIYPRSFMDSDGDGIGDLRGIIQKLEHIVDTGARATWLSPVFPSPMNDFGYDISDFYSIAEEYGTIADFDELVARGRELGLKIILDFVPNHTSDECIWFQLSANRTAGFEDFYVWHPGKIDPNNASNLLPPSNWNSVFRGSAWTWHEGRQEYYLHQFLAEQPDLNFRNPLVVEEMKNVLRFWLDRGAAGFRVDAIPHLFEVDPALYGGEYPDEPVSGWSDDTESYDYLNHLYTRDLPETTDMVYQWRAVVDEYTDETRILMMEAMSDISIVVQFYGNQSTEGAHFPFNFNLAYLGENANAATFLEAINGWLDNVPEGRVSNWVVGNHDQPRAASRFGTELNQGVTMMSQLLPGVGITYQGEEIGMTDQWLTFEDTQDPSACKEGINGYEAPSRDPARTPFHWDDSVNAGFSTAPSTWLPIAHNYRDVNLANQKEAGRSFYKIYQQISRARQEAAFVRGAVQVGLVADDVFAFTRSLESESYVVVVNFANAARTVDLTSTFSSLNDDLSVEIASLSSTRNVGDKLSSTQLTMTAHESLLLKSSAFSFELSVILLVISLVFSYFM